METYAAIQVVIQYQFMPHNDFFLTWLPQITDVHDSEDRYPASILRLFTVNGCRYSFCLVVHFNRPFQIFICDKIQCLCHADVIMINKNRSRSPYIETRWIILLVTIFAFYVCCPLCCCRTHFCIIRLLHRFMLYCLNVCHNLRSKVAKALDPRSRGLSLNSY